MTLSAADNPGGSGVSHILYAFGNDRMPRRYTGPFVVDPGLATTLHAISVDRAGNQSSPVTARIGPERVYLPGIVQ